LKAEFPNEKLQLWPGQFVNVRLLIDTLRQVVVIPTSAVQRGPAGTFVYIIDAETKARMRKVTVSQQDDTRAVIAAGLSADERVVTSGFGRITDGSDVNVSAIEEVGKPPGLPVVEAPPKGKKGGRGGGKKAGESTSEQTGGEGTEKGKKRGSGAQGSEAKPGATP
jgi:multidrug efflux system membrane fusion protein